MGRFLRLLVLGAVRPGVGFLLRLGGGLALESRLGDGVQNLLDLLGVGAVAEEERAVLRDREVVDFVVAGRHVLVDRPGSRGFGDDPDQLLAPVARYVVPDFHSDFLLWFFSAGRTLWVVY